MKQIGKLAVRIIAAASFAMLAVPSTFADSRPADGTWQLVARHDRITVEGRITSIDRERGGYRVVLDHGDYRFFLNNLEVSRAPRRMWVADLRVGSFVRVRGYSNSRGWVDVDSVEWLGGGDRYGDRDRDRDRGYERGVVRGTVTRIDLRRERITLRQDGTNRFIEVNMERVDRHARGADLDDLRRGDHVSLFGGWVRNDLFGAERIEGIHSRH